MLKVIIIDDEPRICEMIRLLIDWNALGYEIVGMADNGITALELVESRTADVVITDIRIPGINGIDLIEQAKTVDPDIDFIIISGFRHFDYAYSAIQCGVEHYLLKPIRREDLSSALQQIQDKRLRTELAETTRAQLREELTETRTGKRAALLQKLFDRAAFEAGSIETLNRTYRCGFRTGLFQTGILRLDNTRSDPSEQHLLARQIKEAFSVVYAPVSELYELLYDGETSEFHFLLNFSPDASETVCQCHRNLLAQTKRFAGAFEGYQITLALGTAVHETLRLQQSAIEASTALKSRVLAGTNRIISASELPVQSPDACILFSSEEDERLRRAIESNRPDEIASFFHAFQSELSGRTGLNVYSLEDTCGRILDTVSYTLHKLPDSNFNRQQFEEDAYALSSASSLRRLFNAMSDLILFHMELYFSKRTMESSRLVRAAKAYIQAHYTEPIRLEDAAKAANYNPSYFSELFKQETGINFSDYLTEVRLEKAKEALRDTNINIRTIAYMVGYRDEKHFSKSFKKIVGISPKDYRKLYLQ